MENIKTIRREYRFTGRVQGVGFRCRARYAAQGLGLTGWVKNEWDGSVLMEVQGREAAMAELLKMINAGTYIMIDRIQCRELPLEEHEYGFHVR